MKRLIVFGTIFGCGLLLLVLVLGPGRLLRQAVDPTIESSDLTDVRSTVAMNDPGQGGRAIGIAAEGAGKIPHWIEVPVSAGVLERLKEWELSYRGIEAFPGGVHFTKPSFELFPAKRPDERPTTTLDAEGSDVAMRGDSSKALQLNDRLRAEDIKAFTLSPGVVLRTFDEAGGPLLTLTTDRLESPEVALDASGRRELASTLIAPTPVRIVHADGSLDLRAGGMVLARQTGRLEFAPPLAITTTGVALPGIGASAGAAIGPTNETRPAPTPREPVVITSDGPATFVRAPEAAASATVPLPTAAQGEAGRLGALFGPGELLFTGHVVVTQGDRSLATERLRMQIARADDGTLFISELDAGVPDTPVAIRLLGGRGSAARVEWSVREQGLVLTGPVRFDDLVVGEGANAKRLLLTAQHRVVVREEPATATLPERVVLTLKEAAHLGIAGELAADGATIVIELIPPTKGADGKAGAARLLEARLIGELAHAELPGRGNAVARTIRLADDGSGGQIVHLDGDARADFAQGFVEGASLELHVPADPNAPSTVIVPSLAAAEFDLPAGSAPFEPRFATTAADPTTAEIAPGARRLVIEPLAACSFTRVGERTDFIGRARYRVRENGRELQELTADEFHLAPDGSAMSGATSGEMKADARGTVVLRDEAQGLTLHAAAMRTEKRGRGDSAVRLLVIEGMPADATLPLSRGSFELVTVLAPRLELDLDAGTLNASGDAMTLARLQVPEKLLVKMLPTISTATGGTTPASEGATAAASNATPPPVVIECEALFFAPEAATGQLDRGTLRFERRVKAMRPRDGATITAAKMTFDLAAVSALVEGTSAEPAVLAQPKRYDPSRVESLTAEWVRLERGGARARTADRAIFVLHPEEAPTAAVPIPQFRRVELRAHDGPDLIGDRILLTGGVEFDFAWAVAERDGTTTQRTAHCVGDRAQLDLDHPLTEGACTLLLLTLTQHVEFDFDNYHLAGATLIHRLAGTADAHPAPGDFLLREGVERARLDGEDAAGDWRVVSEFPWVLVTPPTAEKPDFTVLYGPIHLVFEAARGR